MVHITTAIVVLKACTLVLGGLITYYAFRAYRRTTARPLGILAVGFAVVTIGSLLAGVVDQFTAQPAANALVIESGLTVVGFAVILYSLYVR